MGLPFIEGVGMFDIDAYKTARLQQLDQESREDLARQVALLHEKVDQLIALVQAQNTKASKTKE